jgi:Holliday junction DNA helicase RuvA
METTMIAHLTGRVLDKASLTAIIDVHGVGYEVYAPSSVLREWTLNDDVSIHICTVVREDSFQLFGFSSRMQKETFETLRSVNKIGAKLALTILSHLDVNQLSVAIQTKNSATLSSVPGIGKKNR